MPSSEPPARKFPGPSPFSLHRIPDAAEWDGSDRLDSPVASAPFYPNKPSSDCQTAFDEQVDLMDFDRAADNVTNCIDPGGLAGAMRVVGKGVLTVLDGGRKSLPKAFRGPSRSDVVQEVWALNDSEQKIFAMALHPQAKELSVLVRTAIEERSKGIRLRFFHQLNGGKIVVETRSPQDPKKIFVEEFANDGMTKLVPGREIKLLRESAAITDSAEANIAQLRRELPSLEQNLY